MYLKQNPLDPYASNSRNTEKKIIQQQLTHTFTKLGF